MKILFVIPTLTCGGAERVSTTLAKILSKQHEIEFVNISSNAGEFKENIEQYFKLSSLNCQRTISSFFPLKKIIKRKKPDFVFASHLHVAVVLMLISLVTKTKVIVRFPTMPSNKLYKGIKIKILELFERLLFRKAFKIIAQTEEMKREIQNILHINESKILTLNNPIDTQLIDSQTLSLVNPFKETGTIYLSVGNISPAKGYDILIESFMKIYRQNEQAHLYILGRTNNDYAKGIISQAAECPNVHFLGFCENPYIYMKYCSVFVLSSIMEGLPNVVLEAMYLNRPVVATTCVPIINKLITDGKNGYKVAPGDKNELARAMQKAVNLGSIFNPDRQQIINYDKIFDA